MRDDNDIKAIFREDIKEKKIIGRGVCGRASRKKGFKGKMRTPVDFMKGQEKKDYINRKVVVYSMFDTLVSFDEFKSFDMEKRKKYMVEYLKRFSRREIADKWGVKTHTVNDHVHRLGLSQPNPAKGLRHTTTRVKIVEATPTLANTLSEKIEGFKVTFGGSYKGKEIQERLLSISQLLVEDREYNIQIILAGQ